MFKKLSALYTLIREDLRILGFALRHPARPVWLLPALVALGLYVLSPIDLLPDLVPVLGWVDDLILVPLVIAWLVSRLPVDLRRAWQDARRTVDAPAVRRT
ncbi:MAG TPA: DUF1232 domain-containing protein [Rhodocyclaceae bacterium]|nr:DUF1232 domain-containing protein [Rhodocyclaceae bacterium]